jgi:hypothetical protein
MPAKMMKLMPLPMPFSVINSPSHISSTDPTVRARIMVRLSYFSKLNDTV